MPHISDHDLERFYLGMITDDGEIATIEEHLLVCADCIARAEDTQDFVDAIRKGLLGRDVN